MAGDDVPIVRRVGGCHDPVIGVPVRVRVFMSVIIGVRVRVRVLMIAMLMAVIIGVRMRMLLRLRVRMLMSVIIGVRVRMLMWMPVAVGTQARRTASKYRHKTTAHQRDANSDDEDARHHRGPP